MMLRGLKYLFGISRNLRPGKVELLSDLSMLQKQIRKQYFFVRKNNIQIGQQIQSLVKQHHWNHLRRALNLITIAELDSWLTLRKIAVSLQSTLNSTYQIQCLQKREMEDMLAVLTLLCYEPVAQNGRISSGQYLYDDIADFTIFLKKYVDFQQKRGISQHYLQLVRYLIHCNPEFFQNNKDNIQRHIAGNLDQMLAKGYYITDVISRGLISDFWTHPFKRTLMNKLSSGNYTKQLAPFLFQNESIANLIQPSTSNQRNKTELDISNILAGYHYDIQSNVLINNYEVDALLGKTIVIEYNGHYHYAINSQKMVPTLKQAWKCEVLTKRGFLVISIPYWQWKFLKLFEQKRDYLLKKVENQIIRHYSLKKKQSKI